MIYRSHRSALCAIAIASVTLVGCSSSTTTPTTTTTTTTTTTNTTTPKPSLDAPVAVSPLSGAIVTNRPALTVTNAARTGSITGAVTYTFDVASNPEFSPIVVSGSSPEGIGSTSFTLTTDLANGTTYYWRATAIDAADNVTSPSSGTQTIATVSLSTAEKIAAQQGRTLWPGTQPPGSAGRTNLGPGWGVQNTADFLGNPYLNPTLDNLRVFDLLDRGMNANAVIGWMNSNGYFTNAVYYPEVSQGVYGFPQNYMTLIGTSWELVRRVGA